MICRFVRKPLSQGLTSLRALTVTMMLIAVAGIAIPGHAQSSAKTPGSPYTRAVVTEKIDPLNVVALSGGHHPWANAKTDRGMVADAMPMEHIQLGLRRAPEVQKAFDALVEELHTPGSASYHKWLTPSEIGKNFGPAQPDVARLTAWLEGQGFKINFVMQSGMVVDFSGDAGMVREAFHTEMHNIQLHDGRKFVAAMSEPQIPAAFRELVAGVPSMSSIPPKATVEMRGAVRFDPKTRGVKSLTDMKGNTSVNANPDVVFTCPPPLCSVSRTFNAVGPQDFYVIYNELPLLQASTPINGSGQTVAVLEETDINTADVTTFRTAFNVTPNTPTLTVQHGSGSITCNDPGKLDTQTDEEEWVADVDADWVGAAAPGATILYESCQTTASTQGVLLAAEAVIDNNLAVSTTLSHEIAEPVLGVSLPTWGAQSLWTNLWEQAAAQGITAVVAAGDTGVAMEDANLTDLYLDNPYSYYGANVNGIGATAYNVSAGATDFQDAFNLDINVAAYGPAAFWNTTNGAGDVTARSYPPETAFNGSCAGSLEAFANNFSLSNLAGYCGLGTNNINVFGGGGGTSVNIAQPSWQSGVYGVNLNITSGKRGIPDVSMFASNGFWGHIMMFCDSDPWAGDNTATTYPCTFTNGTDATQNAGGGTAFSAAELAGIFALVAQKTGERQGQADYVLYGMAANEYGTSTYKPGCNGSGAQINNGTTSSLYFPPASTCVFNDITTGNNDVVCEHSGVHTLSTCYVAAGKTYGVVSTSSTTLNPLYAATFGWDYPTGLGSVNIANLVNGWIGGTYSAAFTATVSLADSTLNGVSWSYGNPPASSNLVATVTGNGSLPTGTVTDSVTPTVGTVGTGTIPATGCSTLTGTSGGSGTCQSSNVATVAYAPSASLAVGGYTIASTYSTVNENYTTGAKGTLAFTVTAQAMAYGTGSVMPSSVAYGANQSVVLSQIVNWTGSGTAPNVGSFTFTVNGTGYVANCVGGSGTYTCSYALPGPAVDQLAAGSYVVSLGFVADGNYAAISAYTVGTLTVSQNATTTAVSAAPNSIGPGSASTLTVTVADSIAGGGIPAGTVAFSDTTNSAALGSCTLSNGSCSIAVAGTSLAAGANTIKGIYSPSVSADWTASNGSTSLTLTAPPTTTISLTQTATGSTTTGVTSTTLTANITASAVDGSWGGTVTFKNTTTGATYPGSVTGAGTAGSASVTITEPDAGTAAGLNSYTATFNGTVNYQASIVSSSSTVYWQGLLVSSSLNHNFSGLMSYGTAPIMVEGTVDGAKAGPYGVVVYNFSTAAQSVGLNFTNSSSGAFSSVTNCPASLAPGATCNYLFYYDPPNGDGCNPTLNCTKDALNYPQGTYEAATWTVASSAMLGVGLKGFAAPVRSGAVTFPATLAGKAVLPQGSQVSVTPLSYSFGPLAPNELSSTLTIVVKNTGSASVALTYTSPVTTPFQATGYCPANLAANSSCNINVTFVNSSIGTVTDSLVIVPSGGSPITVTLSGTVNGNNGLQLSTIAHNFGNVGMGSSGAAFGLSITNRAATAAALSFGSSQSGATPYSVVSSGCPASLAAGAQCSVLVNFTPTAIGAASDVLTIQSSVPVLPSGSGGPGNYSGTVTFTGAGAASGQFTATSVAHNWGDVAVGTTATNYGVQLTNTTATALTLSLGSGFSQGLFGFNEAGTSCGATLAVNGSCELIFSFSPTGAGQVNTTFGVSAVDASNNPVALTSGGAAYSAIGLLGTGQ